VKVVTLDDLQRLSDALSDVTGFLTDNSCSDPDCCGGPFYEYRDFEDGLKVLAEFGLEFRK